MSKGFTLIELLAVILILGIVALIAIPTITSVIEDSKKGSLKVTANTIADAAEKQCQIEQMHGKNITKFYGISNGILSSPLDIKNTPNSGSISVDDECNASVAVSDKNYCAIKNGEDVSINSDIMNCNTDNIDIPTTNESCYIFDEASRTITGYNFANTSCPSEISIPATINNVPVEHIADFAFINGDYQYMIAKGYNVTYDDMGTSIKYIEHDSWYDLLDNINKKIDTIAYIRFVNFLDSNLKKECYYADYTYDEKSYDYLIKDSDPYIGCYLDSEDESIDSVYFTGLTGVDFSHATNLISIGNAAFANNEIEKLAFGELPNLTSLGISSFTYNYITGILDLSGLTGLREIDNDAFSYNDIVKVVFPNNITSIGYSSFRYNDIMELNLPSTINDIQYYSFRHNNIKKVVIPENTRYVMKGAFYNNEITSLTLNDNIQDIYPYSFFGNQLSEIDLPDNLLSIRDYAFSDNNFTNIDLPNKLVYLSGFDYNSITELTIPNSVKEIGEYAFQNNELTNLTIPSNVQYLYPFAFCENNLNTLNLGGGLLEIDYGAFSYGRGTISSVVIPNSITTISDGLFYNTKINNLTIGNNVTLISAMAFYNSEISTINWGTTNKLREIGNNVFYGCRLVDLVIPNGVTYIDYGAFSNCIYIQTINIPDSVEVLSWAVFNVTPSLKIANIGSGITSIGESCFGCYNDSCGATININRKPDSVSGAPWNAKNSIINWIGTN